MSLADIRASLGARDRQIQALETIAAAPNMEIDSERLCYVIYGATDPKSRTAMRVTVNGLPWKGARTGTVARQWVSERGGKA